MIVVDTNILVYAHRAGAPENRRAQACIEALVQAGKAWGFAWASVLEFWSQVTHPRYPGSPSGPGLAADFINALVATADARILLPGDNFTRRLTALAVRLNVTGVRVFDLQIALAAQDAGAVEIWTHDRHFIPVPGLRLHDPLA